LSQQSVPGVTDLSCRTGVNKTYGERPVLAGHVR